VKTLVESSVLPPIGTCTGLFTALYSGGDEREVSNFRNYFQPKSDSRLAHSRSTSAGELGW
jgi:hypothetical protein